MQSRVSSPKRILSSSSQKKNKDEQLLRSSGQQLPRSDAPKMQGQRASKHNKQGQSSAEIEFSPMLLSNFGYLKQLKTHTEQLVLSDTTPNTSKIVFPCLIQRKYNGIRGIYYPETKEIKSRQGHTLHNVDHIVNHCKQSKMGKFYIDGEIYCHNMPLQLISGIVRNEHPIKEAIELKFLIFDIVMPGFALEKRIEFLEQQVDPALNSLELAPTYLALNVEKALEYTVQWLNDGYEGCVLKNTKAEYVYGRTTQAARIKKRASIDCCIDSFVTDKVGAIVWKVVDPFTFSFVQNQTLKNRVNQFNYLSDNANNAVFQKIKQIPFEIEYDECSVAGVPQRARGIHLRLDKSPFEADKTLIIKLEQLALI